MSLIDLGLKSHRHQMGSMPNSAGNGNNTVTTVNIMFDQRWAARVQERIKGKDGRNPPCQNFFIFMQFLGENGQKEGWRTLLGVPLWECSGQG